MSVIVIAVATESGVPIFSRKRGNCDNVRVNINKNMIQLLTELLLQETRFNIKKNNFRFSFPL